MCLETRCAGHETAARGSPHRLPHSVKIETVCATPSRRRVIILVKAGAPVDQTIEQLTKYMEEGDIIIDGGNEW